MVRKPKNEAKLKVNWFQVATVQRPAKPRHTDRLLPRPGRPLLRGWYPVGHEVYEVWMWNTLSLWHCRWFLTNWEGQINTFIGTNGALWTPQIYYHQWSLTINLIHKACGRGKYAAGVFLATYNEPRLNHMRCLRSTIIYVVKQKDK